MPVYEYDCEDCGQRFEVLFRSAAEAPEVRCSRCGGGRVARRISAAAVLHPERRSGTPAKGELRPADARALTGNVASRYAAQTGDSAIKEVAREVERGTEAAELQDLVRGVKEERASRAGKGRKPR